MAEGLDRILEKYPRLANLQGKVPEEVLVQELAEKIREYEELLPRARKLIRTANLCDVFPAELEHEELVLKDFLGRWGNVSVEELCKICLIVRWLKPQRLFEIGTYNGVTTRQMALNSPADGQIITLDIDPRSEQAAGLEIGEIDRHLARKAGDFAVEVGERFQGTPEQRKIAQVWGDSTTFDFAPYENSMDAVFIDAGHTYDYVMADTKNALRLLRERGAIIWHDCYQPLHPGVMAALCEFADQGIDIHHLRNTNLAVYYRP